MEDVVATGVVVTFLEDDVSAMVDFAASVDVVFLAVSELEKGFVLFGSLHKNIFTTDVCKIRSVLSLLLILWFNLIY